MFIECSKRNGKMKLWKISNTREKLFKDFCRTKSSTLNHYPSFIFFIRFNFYLLYFRKWMIFDVLCKDWINPLPHIFCGSSFKIFCSTFKTEKYSLREKSNNTVSKSRNSIRFMNIERDSQQPSTKSNR